MGFSRGINWCTGSSPIPSEISIELVGVTTGSVDENSFWEEGRIDRGKRISMLHATFSLIFLFELTDESNDYVAVREKR